MYPVTLLHIPQNQIHTEREKFEDTEDIERNLTNELLALHANEFRKCFQQLYERSQKCYPKIIMKNIKRYV
jgi:hypothetical protein